MSADIIGVDEVLDDPQEVAQHLLRSDIYGLVNVEVRLAERSCVVFWLTLEPWAAMAEHGYPTERVSITVWASRRILAVPLAPGRAWLHRMPSLFGELCIWFPGDPRALRWEWPDGLVAYITLVHRHLQAEECWRRHGVWPAEDAPHGGGDHPIRSLDLRWAASQATR
jgi:hypothetical protein